MDEQEQMPTWARQAVGWLIVLIVVAALITGIDYAIKRNIVKRVDEFKQLAGQQQGGSYAQPAGHVPASRAAAPRAAVPDAAPGWLAGAGMGDESPRGQENGEARAAPVVQPGDESHRPPRRGQFNAP